jgi:hypothetical protein
MGELEGVGIPEELDSSTASRLPRQKKFKKSCGENASSSPTSSRAL